MALRTEPALQSDAKSKHMRPSLPDTCSGHVCIAQAGRVYVVAGNVSCSLSISAGRDAAQSANVIATTSLRSTAFRRVIPTSPIPPPQLGCSNRHRYCGARYLVVSHDVKPPNEASPRDKGIPTIL